MKQEHWRDLCGRMRCHSAAERFTELEQAHSEKHRRYHTAQHIAECLALFDTLRDLCEFPDEVEFAIWLHDVIYGPRRSDNEERSAELAVTWLTACQVEEASVDRIRRLILATRHTSRPLSRDEQILVDIDLHILGASADRFDEYETQVRGEFKWVPAILFNRSRAQILAEFQSRDPLFNTEWCQAQFEASAKRNLSRSLARLTS